MGRFSPRRRGASCFGVDLVGLFQLARAQNFKHKFMRKKLAGFVGDPFFETTDSMRRFPFLECSIGDAVHVAGEEGGFVFWV